MRFRATLRMNLSPPPPPPSPDCISTACAVKTCASLRYSNSSVLQQQPCSCIQCRHGHDAVQGNWLCCGSCEASHSKGGMSKLDAPGTDVQRWLTLSLMGGRMGGPVVRFFVVVGAPCFSAATTCSLPLGWHPCNMRRR